MRLNRSEWCRVVVSIAVCGTHAVLASVPFDDERAIASTIASPWSAASADLDGDGDEDVLVAARSAATVSWFENDGATPPEFVRHDLTTSLSGASCVRASDLDRDGDLDVFACGAFLGGQVVWYENGGGSPASFSAHPIAAGVGQVESAFAADLDRDGDPDLVAAVADGPLIWFESDGAATPSFVSHVIGIEAAWDAIAVDLDRDADVDVVSASDDGLVRWYENDGASPPGFAPQTAGSGGAPRSVDAADLDGDGDLDVLVAFRDEDRLAWLDNDGQPSPVFAPRTIATGLAAPQTVRAVDLDGDGDLDALAASRDDDRVAWFESDGATPPAFVEHTLTTSANEARDALAADLDRDGDPDVLAASSLDDEVVWFENRTIHRSAAFPAATPLPGMGEEIYEWGDVDGDGDPDLVAAAFDPNATLSWYENDGERPPAFATHTIDDTLDDFDFGPLVLADLDRDADLDVALVTGDAFASTKKLSWYENELGGQAWTERVIAYPGNTSWLEIADLDGDGDVDLVSSGFELAVWDNDGASPPSFVPRTLATIQYYSVDVDAADLDGDGDVDLVAEGNNVWDAVAWFESDGGVPPAFTEREITPAESIGTLFNEVADLDGDGDLDVVGTTSAWELFWWENSGGSPPVFVPHAIVTYGLSFDEAVDVTAADLDGDADIDLVWTSFSDNVYVELNDGASPPSFERSSIGLVCAGLHPLTVDLDRDGDRDVVASAIACGDEPTVWFENRGGQFALPTADLAPLGILQGTSEALLSVEAIHRGRPGDGDVELAGVVLRLEDDAGEPLTTGAATGLIASLTLHLDDGSGEFDPGTDASVATVAPLSLEEDGTLVWSFAASDPSLVLTPATARLYFVVAELAPGAATAQPNAFRVTHEVETGAVALDADAGLALRVEGAADVSTPVITVVAGPAGAVPNGGGVPGPPLRLDHVVGSILDFSWGASCSSGDFDYAVYVGLLGEFSTTEPLVCSTGGETTARLFTGSGNRFFLVVPSNGAREGSYGTRSDGAPRLQGPEACLPQNVGLCD